jgi:hypothetical protein
MLFDAPSVIRLYTSTSIIRVIKSKRMRSVRHVACTGELRNSYIKPEGKRQLGRSRRRSEDNISKDLGEIG